MQPVFTLEVAFAAWQLTFVLVFFLVQPNVSVIINDTGPVEQYRKCEQDFEQWKYLRHQIPNTMKQD